MKDLPRSEYPRPQFVRPDWLCLNGTWQFEIDMADTGLERGLRERELTGQITVPFCPESPLSGVGKSDDFLNSVWYRREVTLPAQWGDRHVHLHFQAVDRDTTVWLQVTRDGTSVTHEVGRHRGGWVGFTCDLSPYAKPGETVTIIVRARDDMKKAAPIGKQCDRIHYHTCHYVRTTGIWQSVWLEPVPASHLKRPRITPDVANSRFRIEQAVTRMKPGMRVRVALADSGKTITTKEARADIDFVATVDVDVPEANRKLWEPGKPFLYDLTIELLDDAGHVLDRATSYAGLRSVAITGHAVLINGKPVFQRTVLDQGYYPDGILTAPSEVALIRDIELAMSVGFNGARLHQKVFEERFLYHCDRLGYLVWGEFGDWGINRDAPHVTTVTQWLEALHRDYSHPAIIGWCGLNETWQPINDHIAELSDVTQAMFLAAKAIDRTRPVLDASGYSHRVPETDVWDCHDYDQNPVTFKERHAKSLEGEPFANAGTRDNKPEPWSVPYRGQPVWVSEFGGALWNPKVKPGDFAWGYGDRPKTLDEFYARFDALCTTLLENPAMFGYCYTQLTDVYQEQNGLFFFDRSSKFDAAKLKAVQQKPAAIERVG
ncbi:MAG: glycoside hydrolase family 2 TIM barrel-domain containing protein [Tepidisphaeraceae bacterium]